MKFKFILTASALSLTIATQANAQDNDTNTVGDDIPVTLTCPTIIPNDCTFMGDDSGKCNISWDVLGDDRITINYEDPGNPGANWLLKDHSIGTAPDNRENAVYSIVHSGSYVGKPPSCVYTFTIWTSSTKHILTVPYGDKTISCSDYTNGVFTCTKPSSVSSSSKGSPSSDASSSSSPSSAPEVSTSSSSGT